jgi:outer membrane protein insertion porin family
MSPTLLALAIVAAPLPGATPEDAPRVAVVRIEAPAQDAARLGGYVAVAPGDVLSAEAVRHSVELLYATGEFADVQVETVERPDGVELVVRLVPAPLLQEVRIEGDALLGADRVRRIAGLGPRERLWTARLERAARDVALALAADGYLEAQANAEARPLPHGAAAVFTLRAGPRARVSTLEVAGEPDGDAAGLRRLAAPAPRSVYRRAVAQRAARKMRERLVERGHWRASVELREAYDPASAVVAVVFDVAPGPTLALAFRGAEVPIALRRRIEKLLRDGGLGIDALDEADELLEQDYRRRGHRDARVTRREEPGDAGRLQIVYEVEPGPPAIVAAVELVGAPPPAPQLALETRAEAPLRDVMLAEDARALKRWLEQQGHAAAAVEGEVADGGGRLPVVFRLRPGARTLVAGVKVEAPEPRPGPARELRTKVGEPYRLADLAADRAELLATYRDAGYLQAEVTPDVTFSEDRGQAEVVLHVAPGRPTRVDHIVIAGLERTRETVVRRELTLAPGDPLSLQQLLESQRRLSSLGVFRRVSLAEIDPESPAERSLVVVADEAPQASVAYGLGYAERELLRASAEVTRRNLSGLDRSLSAYVRASFRGSRGLLTYREPYLFGHKQELFATVFREEDDRESFDYVRYGGVLQTLRGLGPRWTLILRQTFQLTRVFDVEVPLDEVDRQFQSSTFSGPAVSLVNDTRNDPLDPRRGHFASADVQFSHRLLGGDTFVKSFLQASSYRRLGARTLLAVGGRLGLARTLGRGEPLRVPLPDRFFAGGDYSLRGFALDTVGPREPTPDGRLIATGGNGLLLGSAELRRELGRRFSLAAFTDAGNVYTQAADIQLDDLRVSAGLGLRYRSALGPLRADWGYKLNRRSGESPYRIHVTIGHAF